MLLCDALRGPLMLAVPLLHWADALSFAVLVAVALVLGAFGAPYFAANRLILPELLGEDEAVVSQASALFQGATRITLLLGSSSSSSRPPGPWRRYLRPASPTV